MSEEIKPVQKFKLEWKFSQLYSKVSYLTELSSMVNTIIEYDLKDAGFSVIRDSKLLHQKHIDKLANMDKHQRKVAIGKLQLKDKSILKGIPRGIENARMNLFKSNLVKDFEVLSIKNDAVFIVGRKLRSLQFGEMQFVPKNEYTSFHQFNGIEYYYNKRQEKLDIKGISDDIVREHEDGILKFLRTVFRYIEMDQTKQLKKYLVDFSIAYKSRKLPVVYYKECNHLNLYRYKDSIGEYSIQLLEVGQESVDELDIIYNYNFFVLPMLQKYLY